MRLWILALCVAVGGCRTGGDKAPDEATETPPPVRSELTGVLTEEGFKALHELRADAAPARTGHDVEVAGERAYLSLPAGASGPLPTVIVIHEWWGLNENIMHWADRLAADGYAALAVDLYGGKVATTPDDAMAYMQTVDEARALEILKAARAFVGADERVKASKVGVVGWCFGGGWSLRTGLDVEGVDAIAMYYGHPVDDPKRLKSLGGPLLGVFGNLDRSIPPATVDAFEKSLGEAAADHRILRYEADHAFANPSSARYDEKNAAVAWEEVRGFFTTHLKGETP